MALGPASPLCGRNGLATDRHRHGVLQHRLSGVDPSERGYGERGMATSSIMFMRIVGNSVGAAVFGAILNYGVSRRIPEAGEAVNRLLSRPPATNSAPR